MAKMAKNGPKWSKKAKLAITKGQKKSIGDDVRNFLEGERGQLPDLS